MREHPRASARTDETLLGREAVRSGDMPLPRISSKLRRARRAVGVAVGLVRSEGSECAAAMRSDAQQRCAAMLRSVSRIAFRYSLRLRVRPALARSRSESACQPSCNGAEKKTNKQTNKQTTDRVAGRDRFWAAHVLLKLSACRKAQHCRATVQRQHGAAQGRHSIAMRRDESTAYEGCRW